MIEDKTLKCIECLSPENVRTANGIPICNLCIEESREQFKAYEEKRIKLNPNFSEIIENKLYLGNYDQAKSKDSLKKLKITHVLVCGAGLEKFYPDDFIYEKYDIEDIEEQDIKMYFAKAIEFIETGEIVYAHCHAGVSRSASIVIAYIMYKMKMTFDQAFEFLRNKRSCIFPHEKFRDDLRLFEKEMNISADYQG